MTYLLYSLWILSLVLVVSELDSLVSRRLLERHQVTVPEVPWMICTIASTFLPGVGQFLNGQIVKAFFFLIWPFMVIFSAPVPRPWQMVAINFWWLLLPWWIVAIADALIVGLARQRERYLENKRSLAASNTTDFYAYLDRKQSIQKREN